MSKKEIILKVNELLKSYEWYKKGDTYKTIKGLLDLYNKQQKEIEMLKIIHDTYKEEIRSIENRYISKNKIKELLYQLKKEDRERLDYLGEILGISGLYPDMTYIKIRTYLEKLLEE